MDGIMDDLKLRARGWTGMGLPPPYHGNWLYDLGVATIFFFPSVALLVVSLRVWGRWRFGTLGIGTSQAAPGFLLAGSGTGNGANIRADDLFAVLAMVSHGVSNLEN
jgi:hypothetical protein